MNLPPRLALVGFMGSGKSTVGRLLAARINYEFIDIDIDIERNLGLSVQEIFRTRGEAAFRLIESNAVRKALERERTIVSPGGGAFAQDALADELLRNALVVYLDCDFDEAYRRVRDQGGRPLLEKGEIEAAALYAGRKDKYARAHVTVNTTNRAPADVANDVLGAVQQTLV